MLTVSDKTFKNKTINKRKKIQKYITHTCACAYEGEMSRDLIASKSTTKKQIASR